MSTVIISIILVLAVLLILVILGQNSKGGAGAAFGGCASQIMGVTRTGNVLEKATWILAVSIMVLALVFSIFYSSSQVNQSTSVNREAAKQQGVAPAVGGTETQLPASGGTQGDTTPTK